MTSPSQIKASLAVAIAGDHTDAGAAYAALGTTENDAAALIINSSFNLSVWLSVDGTNDYILLANDALNPSYSLTLNFGANKQGTGQLILPKGTTFYLKQGPDGAPTSGDISITVLYGE